MASLRPTTQSPKDITTLQERLHATTLALQYAMPGMARLDANGLYLEVNEAYATLLGYAPNELVGHEWAHTVLPEDRPAVREAFVEMQRQGSAKCEMRACRKDGTSCATRIVLVQIDAEAGEAASQFCYMQDISEQRRVEQALRISEERYRALYDNNPSMCFMVTPEAGFRQSRLRGYRARESDRLKWVDARRCGYWMSLMRRVTWGRGRARRGAGDGIQRREVTRRSAWC